MGRSARATIASAVLAVALSSQPSPARASDPPPVVNDRASAESLFDEGRKLLDEGRLEEACAKLDASNRMDPAVGTLLNLGECNERRGRLATAWGNYRAAASLALTRGDAARADFARKRSEAVQPRLSTLTLVVAAPEADLRVKRDGVPVEKAAWGAALPIDAGPHVIEAQAPGKKPWTGKVVIAEGPPQNASLKIEPLVVDASQADTTLAPPSSAHDTTPGVGADGRPATMRALGFIGLGAGAIALGAGAYFALHARSVWSDAEPHCDSSHRCDDVGFALNHDARRSGDIATGAIVAGLVLAAAGALAIVLAPSRSAAPSQPRPLSTVPSGFTLRPDGMGLSFHVP